MRGSEGQRAIDKEVGNRIRVLRGAVGLSQMALGDALGITFQQVQKYEKGLNRVSVRQLAIMAEALKCTIGDILGGDPGRAGGEVGELLAVMSSKDGLAMARAFAVLPESRRRAIVVLMREFSEC